VYASDVAPEGCCPAGAGEEARDPPGEPPLEAGCPEPEPEPDREAWLGVLCGLPFDGTVYVPGAVTERWLTALVAVELRSDKVARPVLRASGVTGR
jgi:hypothetical protein